MHSSDNQKEDRQLQFNQPISLAEPCILFVCKGTCVINPVILASFYRISSALREAEA